MGQKLIEGLKGQDPFWKRKRKEKKKGQDGEKYPFGLPGLSFVNRDGSRAYLSWDVSFP